MRSTRSFTEALRQRNATLRRFDPVSPAWERTVFSRPCLGLVSDAVYEARPKQSFPVNYVPSWSLGTRAASGWTADDQARCVGCPLDRQALGGTRRQAARPSNRNSSTMARTLALALQSPAG